MVVDLPEAIFSNLGLIFLAHTHIPTVWDEKNVVIDNVDWTRTPEGGLEFERSLPNGIRFGAEIIVEGDGAGMRLWLENGTDAPLTGLRTQVCAMLKGATGFDAQSKEGKVFESPVAAAKTMGDDRWVLIAFDRCGRSWGNSACPCSHADPVFPDAGVGERVEVGGRIWFYEGTDFQSEVERARKTFPVHARN